MKTFKVGDRVRVKDECVGKEYRYPKDGGNGTIIGRESVELDWRVHLDKQRDRNDWWSYRESELILLEDTMECTVNGVTYRQLRNIAVTSLILAGARDNDIDFFARVYGYLPTIPINVALDYCTKGPHACNEKLQWLVDQGFVEVVEERKIDIDQILRIGGIQKRGSGNLASKSAYLSRTFSWSIEIDDKGVQCLVPKHKR